MLEKDKRHISINKQRGSDQLFRRFRRSHNPDVNTNTESLSFPEIVDYWGEELVGYRDILGNSLFKLDMEAGKNLLIGLLKEHGIPIEEWSKTSTKTLHHLYNELISHESILSESGDGYILRLVKAVGVDVFYRNYKGDLYRLIEGEQVFGESKKRNRTLNTSIAEKVFSKENMDEAARRAVREELNILGDLQIKPDRLIEETRMSSSYPGLPSRYKYYMYTLYLSADQYRPEGYVEVQTDKKTYFRWQGFNH